MAFEWLTDAFSGAPQRDAADKQIAELRRGQQQYDVSAGAGRGALQTNYTAALDPWMNLQGTAQGGTQAYADATGANGPEGLARARAQFQANPGLQFAQDEARRSVERSGVAGGAASGNIIQGVGDRAQQLGMQNWNQYVKDLQPWLNQGMGVAGGLSGTYQGLGNALAGSYQNQGQAQLGTAAGIGKAESEGELGRYTGSGNLWNLAGNLGGSAFGAAGKAGGFGKLFEGAGKLFG